MSNPTNPDTVQQDLDEIVTRTISFAHDLNGSTLTGTPTWTVPTGLTLLNSSNTTTTATFQISAQATGPYVIECRVDTAAGDRLQCHLTVLVTD